MIFRHLADIASRDMARNSVDLHSIVRLVGGAQWNRRGVMTPSLKIALTSPSKSVFERRRRRIVLVACECAALVVANSGWC